MICCLCDEKIEVEASGWSQGHNALPLMEGRCCVTCNMTKVIPDRINRRQEDERD